MPDFTPEQIKDAMENPRVGDVWDRDGRTITVEKIWGYGGMGWVGSDGSFGCCDVSNFGDWIYIGTLIRRGA